MGSITALTPTLIDIPEYTHPSGSAPVPGARGSGWLWSEYCTGLSPCVIGAQIIPTALPINRPSTNSFLGTQSFHHSFFATTLCQIKQPIFSHPSRHPPLLSPPLSFASLWRATQPIRTFAGQPSHVSGELPLRNLAIKPRAPPTVRPRFCITIGCAAHGWLEHPTASGGPCV